MKLILKIVRMILFILFYSCARWWYTVTFTKVLTIYQIYHTWIYPFHHFPLSSPHSWMSFNSNHFTIYIHVYTVFVPYSPLPPSSTSHWYPPCRQDVFCPPVFQFCKRKKVTLLFVYDSYTGSLIVTFPYIYNNPNWFTSFIFFFLPLSPSYGDSNRFKNSVFIKNDF
jgi:hypothetical protein